MIARLLRIFRSRTFWCIAAGTGFLFSLLFLALSLWFRSWILRGLPDIAEPFDVAAFERVEMASDQNAFELYRQASERLEPLGAEFVDGYGAATRNDWAHVPEEYRKWLQSNGEPLEIYKAGSQRADAVYVQPGELMWDTQLPVSQSVMDLARLAQLEALHLESVGDCSGAWSWYRAILRSSRHSGRNGGIIERAAGCTIYARASRHIVRWASLPDVDGPMLRQALSDLRAAYATTPLTSSSVKAEYVLFRKIFADRSLVDRCTDWDKPVSLHLTWYAFWSAGEPEASHRMTKLVYTNWLSQCDLPRERRRSVHTSCGMLYSPDPTLGEASPIATTERLEDWLRRAFLRRMIMGAVLELIVRVDAEQAMERLLETALAAEIYRREEGRYPESLAQLAGRDLDALPVDPFGNGQPIGFRRELGGTEITLWSIGQDEADHEGAVELQRDGSGDLVIHVGLRPSE